MTSKESISVVSVRSKHSFSLKRSRSLRPLEKTPSPPPVDELLAELLKFRIDGRTINARNVAEIYPGLDRLLLRCLQTGDSRQLDNRLKRNLKPEYLLITEKHVSISVASNTQDILDRLVAMGATLDLHFYEPLHSGELELLCKYGWNTNTRLSRRNYQPVLSYLISKNAQIDMIEILIRYGARLDLQDGQGQTPIHYVCQGNVTDSVFDYVMNATPAYCFNIRNQSGATPLDLVYLSAYEKPNWSRLQRIHLLLCKPESKLTRYGMREPNLMVKQQYKLLDVIVTKEFLFKYRLRDIFDGSIRSLAWSIFFFYDVLRACEQKPSHVGSSSIQTRLDHYLISLIENGEIPLNKLIFRSSSRLEQSTMSSSLSTNYEFETKSSSNMPISLLQTAQIQNKLCTIRTKSLTLKALCRIKIKDQIKQYPNDVTKLNGLSKVLQSYVTYYNPFVTTDAKIRI